MKKFKIFLCVILLFIIIDFNNSKSQINTLPAPVLISPENNATGVNGFPIFQWYKVEGATWFKLWVGDSTATIPYEIEYCSDTSNISYQYNEVELTPNAKISWKVKIECSDPSYQKDTSDWSETFKFTTANSILNTPIISLPVYTYMIDTSVTYVWDTVKQADSYHCQMSTDLNFKKLLLDTNGITSSSLDVNGLRCRTIYYFRVQAANKDGVSFWSKINTISTKIQFEYPPKLISPQNNSIRIPTSGQMIWDLYNSNYAINYEIQISNDVSFNKTIIDTMVKEMKFDFENLNSGTYYYWRVRAYSYADISDWSGPNSFRTEYEIYPNLPEQVQLLTPSNGSQYVFWVDSGDIGLTGGPFTWEPVNSIVDNYWLELDISNEFSYPRIVNDITETTYDDWLMLGLGQIGKYYWRVKAGNETGWGPFSEIRWFNLTTVGVDDSKSQTLDLAISPNPASDFIILPSVFANIQIYNIYGNKVLECESKSRIDVSGLSPGLYFLKAGDKVFKFIKM